MMRSTAIDLTDYLASLRGRIGYAFDKALVYATGGVAFLGYSDDIADGLDDDVAVGYVVGGGVEYKLTNNLSVGVEGLYYNFSSDFNSAVEAEEFEGFSAELDRDFWTVQARLNYHFTPAYSEPLK